jgi:hypothetical protein
LDRGGAFGEGKVRVVVGTLDNLKRPTARDVAGAGHDQALPRLLAHFVDEPLARGRGGRRRAVHCVILAAVAVALVGGMPSLDAISVAFFEAGVGWKMPSQQIADTRDLMQRHNIRYVVLDAAGDYADNLQRMVTEVLGRGPTGAVGGVLLWLPTS